ncbi:MAG: alpha-galactosidase [Lentisphaerae bacterium]|nr:alpha-galactosidase [Lentisphaerota bacterium]
MNPSDVLGLLVDFNQETLAERISPDFLYDGLQFSPEKWTKSVKENQQAKAGQEKTIVEFISPDGKLALNLQVVVTPGMGFVEYIPALRGIGAESTGRVSNFQSFSMLWNGKKRPEGKSPLTLAGRLSSVVVRRQFGSQCTLQDFLPQPQTLMPAPGFDTCVMESTRGSSSNDWLPFFGIDIDDTTHFNLAIGWPGAWKATIKTWNSCLQAQVGLLKTDFQLEPGEEVELPTVALQTFDGQLEDMQNVFRQYVVKYKLPRDEQGRIILPPRTMMFSGTITNDALLKYIDLLDKANSGLDSIWIDAGWYGTDREVAWELHQSDWSCTVGDWRINQVNHPGGLKPVTDAAHKVGMKVHLWVETERAVADAPAVKKHPEWFVAADHMNRMLDLGNPEACDYAIETISDLIENQGIDCYREDFNFNTIPFWNQADNESGQIGKAEIKFVNGFLRFWRTLRTKFPSLLIDNCSSGGRRIDWTTISLSIPMWRSDFSCVVSPHNCEANQMAIAFLSPWLPFHCSGHMLTPGLFYDFASATVTTSIFNNCDRCWFMPEPENPDAQRILGNLHVRTGIAKRVREYCLGDFAMLTAQPQNLTNPFAVQFSKGDSGVILAYRRPRGGDQVVQVSPKGIDRNCVYNLEIFEEGLKAPRLATVSGEELARLSIELPEPRSAKIVFYSKAF